MRKPQVLLTTGSWTPEIARLLVGLGARVQILAPGEDWQAAYQHATHILIPGGSDIQPREYGAAVTWARPSAPARDRQELPLARQALAEGKPLFGICRGHQVITVAAGGTLHQDIELDLGVAHPQHPHPIRLHPASRVGRVIGQLAQVNSYHHQAVERVPAGWRVVAESLDGEIIEAIEHPQLPVWSVQWHPEALNDGRLFAAFLKNW